MGNQKYSTIHRELTKDELKQIKVLVHQCANYDKVYDECLPSESKCYMLNKWYTGLYCKWFEQALLPTTPTLENSLRGIRKDTKKCTICGTPFPVAGRKIYCSDKCKSVGKKKADAERAKKYRAKKR